MSELGTTAYEEAKRQAWALPLLALAAYPIAAAMFLSLPSEARPLDDQAAGMLMAAASSLILSGPLAAAAVWLIQLSPRVLMAAAKRAAQAPNAEPSLAKHLVDAFKVRVGVMVTATDAPVLGGLLLALVPGDDMRIAGYVAVGIGIVAKGLAIAAITRRAKPLLLEAGR